MLLSIVIPVFNEAESIPHLLSALCPIALDIDPAYEIVFVDDGSLDATYRRLSEAAESNPHLKILSFSRNFGHQVAVTAGLDFSSGDAVVVMDADLQDPPGLLPRMIELYREGYDIVSPQRTSREADSWFKRWTARMFYKVMQRMVDRRIQPEVGDFRLFSRNALIAIRSFREQHRFMRGLVAWLGLKEAVVPFARQARVAGETKYPFRKMVAFSWTAITSFSGLPLRFSLGLGLFIVFGDVLLMGWVIWAALIAKSVVPGWASLMLVQGIFSGVTLIAVGLLGDYVSRIYDEIKRRPLYIVNRSMNLPEIAAGAGPERTLMLAGDEVIVVTHRK
jgi:glycosyltransferase involved in cell wall biosynthesis